jgi:hypothetical protein
VPRPLMALSRHEAMSARTSDFGGKADSICSHADGINSCRAILPVCAFNEGPCAEGLKVLKAYRKEWDEEHGC